MRSTYAPGGHFSVGVAGDPPAYSRPFLHSGSAKGQFSRSLAELLFAHHRAAQSKLRSSRIRPRPEPMRRAMKSTRLRLAAGGAERVAVMHGTYPSLSAVLGQRSFARRLTQIVGALGCGRRHSVEGVTRVNCRLVSAAPLTARWPVA